MDLAETQNLRPHRGVFTVEYRKNPRARHYILRVERPGRITVTLPPRGNITEAKKFLASREAWVRQQMARQKIIEGEHRWMIGKPILWRGEERILRVQRDEHGWLALLGDEKIPLPWGKKHDIIQCLVKAIRLKAREELCTRTSQLALETGLTPSGVTVRDQRSRWGSCSSRKKLSLNWRLLQAPSWVLDYVIIHELVHIKHFNHGAEYWNMVARVFPCFREAELWLKKHSSLLREPAR